MEVVPVSKPEGAVTASDVLKDVATPTPVETQADPTSVESTETPKVEEPAKEEDRFARKFAELSRREKLVREGETKIKDIQSKYAEYEKAKKNAKDDPIAYLEASGLTYQELTERILEGKPKKDPALRELEERLAKVEQEKLDAIENSKKSEEEKQRTEYKLKQKEHIKAAGEKYELINSLDKYDLVFDTQVEYFHQNNKTLSHDEAADLVEKYLDTEIDKFKGVKKIKSKFEQKLEAALEAKIEDKKPSVQTTSAKEPNKTLTNTMSMNQTSSGPGKLLSREESLARAAAMIKFH